MFPSPAPHVSVVVPLYEKRPYVGRALQSVFAQTLGTFEVIVVDDGSTDEAASVLAEFGDARLVVHRQEHQGVSVARNRGASVARAPWVAFLDADDEWLLTFLESTLRVAEASPRLSAVFSNLRHHRIESPMLTRVSQSGGVVRDYFETLLDNDGVGITSSSVVVSKAKLIACGGFACGVQHAEDIDLWARLAWSGDLGFCEEALAVYHSEIPNSASKNVLAATAQYPVFLRSYEEWSRNGRIPEKLRNSSRRYATWVLAQNVMELAHQGRREEARQRLRSASWKDPRDPHLWRARVWTWLPAGALRMGRQVRTALKQGRTDR